MKYYYNLYKHKDGEFKGQIDDEYYMLDPETKTITCLYKLHGGTSKDVKITLSTYNRNWKFDTEISKFEYGKQLLQLIFDRWDESPVQYIVKYYMEHYND